jgi:TolB protein
MPRWRYGNIAFLSDRDGNFEVYVISDNGTWLRRITLNPATDIMPVWDPDGVRLAFRSDRAGDPAVYVTSGIGGGDFKQFSAAFSSDWMLAGMDWGK